MNHNRSGVALVMAIAILAALMLLGLPFLFSQSSSLTGTRALALNQAVQIYRLSAQNIAIDLASRSVARNLIAQSSSPIVAATVLYRNPLNDPSPSLALSNDPLLKQDALKDSPLLPVDTGNSSTVAVNFANLPGATFNQKSTDTVLVGATIEDEAGKLDPNYMGSYRWQRLLKAAGIVDWADKEVDDSEDLDGINPGDGDEANNFGELAEALAKLRLRLPERRITTIDQLLEADPQERAPQFRHRLTRAELNLLAPFLTLHNPSAARGGLSDLGTVLFVDSIDKRIYPDIPAGVSLPLADGTWLETSRIETIDNTNRHAIAIVEQSLSSAGTINGLQLIGRQSPFAAKDDALAFEIPPQLNIHQFHSVGGLNAVQQSLTVENAPDDLAMPPTPLRTMAELATYLRTNTGAQQYLGIFVDTHETFPIGISSPGVFTIGSAASAVDRRGRALANDERRSVIQAVPQESLLEARWQTQADFQRSIVRRGFSRMQSWPNPIDRVNDAVVDDPDLSTQPTSAIAAETGTKPAILPNVLNYPGQTTTLIEWSAPLGVVKDPQGKLTSTLANVFKQSPVKGATDPILGSDLSDINAKDLRPDGLRIEAGKPIAYGLSDEIDKGALVRRTTANFDMAGRRISFWFQPRDDWDRGKGIVPLAEARMPESNVTKQLTGLDDTRVPGTNDRQNLLGIYYDAEKELLAATYAPPAVERSQDFGANNYYSDVFNTPEINEACLSGSGINLPSGGYLAPRVPATNLTAIAQSNRVVHVFKVRPDYFRKDSWHRVELLLVQDDPLGIRLVLDGVPGGDCSRVGSNALMAHGDTFTFPALPLTTDLPALDPKVAPLIYAADLKVQHIAVTPVQGISAKDLFPSRGMIRIDDEYVSYERVEGDGFHDCVRGQRQNTQTDFGAQNPQSDDIRARVPQLQAHKAGTLVVPGGYRLSLPADSGVLFTGGCVLDSELKNGDSRPNPMGGTEIVPRWQIWDVAQKVLPNGEKKSIKNGQDVKLEGVGVYDDFPANGGIVRIYAGDQLTFAYYTRYANKTLYGLKFLANAGGSPLPATEMVVKGRPLFAEEILYGENEPAYVWLVGIQVGGQDPTEGGRYVGRTPTQSDKYWTWSINEPQLIQLLDQFTGRVEWLEYESIVTLNASFTSNGKKSFFVHSGGWGWYYSFIYANGKWDVETTRRMARGQCRTMFAGGESYNQGVVPYSATYGLTPANTFPQGTMVIPVQTTLGNAGHFPATGDTVTIMPRDFAASPAIGAVPKPKPVQAVVRFAATDGHASDPTNGVANKKYDVKNEWFAFTGPLPTDVYDFEHSLIDSSGQMATPNPASYFDIYCGPCWMGQRDLSPMPNSAITITIKAEAGCLPRLDLLAEPDLTGVPQASTPGRARTGVPQLSTPDKARMVWGGQDIERMDSAASAAKYNAQPMTIDALSAGPVPNQPQLGHIVRFISGSAETLSINSSTALPIVAQAESNLFVDDVGLVSIDGETFGYQTMSTADATLVGNITTALQSAGANNFTDIKTPKFGLLIARGLLDSHDAAGTHAFSTTVAGTPAATTRPTLSAFRLPLGPVARISASIPDSDWFPLYGKDDSTKVSSFPAPAALLVNKDGKNQQEVISLIGPKANNGNPGGDPQADMWITPTWLRGLYRSPKITGLNGWNKEDLAIAWWPRYPSAYPDSGTSPEAMRCRSFAWAGFTARAYGMRVPPAGIAGSEAVKIIGVDANDYFEVVASAQTGQNAWRSWVSDPAVTVASSLTSAFPTSAMDGFFDANANSKPAVIDGYEVRVHWRYKDPPSPAIADIAEAGGRAPAIGNELTKGDVRLRFHAPVEVLATQERR